MLAAAGRMLRYSPPQAVEQLRAVLAEAPESAEAHALLSVALLRTKRIHAAEHEAKLALGIEPMLAHAHFALGCALLAQKKLAPAEAALSEAIAQSPNRAAFRMGLAQLRQVQGRRSEAQVLLQRAVELEPEDGDARCALGRILVELGELDEAGRCADEAMGLEPGSVSCLVLRGHLALRRGRPDEALDFALWALQSDADDGDALGLLAEVKASQGWLLGLWWRYMVFMIARSDRGQILTLIGAFLFVQIGAQAARDLGHKAVAQAIQFVWIGVVVYSFAAPQLFRRMLAKEQKKVQLRSDF